MSLIGVDIGTSGTRIGAFTANGEIIAEVSTQTILHRPGNGLVETDAEHSLGEIVGLLAQLTSLTGVQNDPPQGISFSVQGEAVLPVDREGRALAAAPVSMDRRGSHVVEKITSSLGQAEVQRITGQPVHPMFSIYKIAAEGESWRPTGFAGYRCLGDFVAVRLGGRPVIDTTMAARTGAFDLEVGAWSVAILEAAGVSADELPEVAYPGTQIGSVSLEAASATGLQQGLPIVVGSHDQASSFWGGGGHPGQTSVYAFGSSDCLTVGSHRRPERLIGTGLATYPVSESGWLTLAGTAAGGWALEWLARTVGASSIEERDALLSDVSRGPASVLVLPYLAGSGTLDNDPTARGAIVGLTLDTSKADLARGFLESAGFELRKIVRAFEERGTPVGDIRAVGTGATSAQSLTIRASAAGRTIAAGAGAGSLRGAALQAAVGIGLYASVEAVPQPSLAHVGLPDPTSALWYETQGARYDDLYRALIPINPIPIKEIR